MTSISPYIAAGYGRRRRRRRAGRGILSDLIGAVGLGRRRRRVQRRRRVGRGLFDVIKKVATAALPFIKKSGIVSHAVGMIPGVGGIASAGTRALGWGRRRRVRRRRIGGIRKRRAGLHRRLF